MRRFWLALIIMPMLAASCNKLPESGYESATLKIKDSILTVEVADDEPKRTLGLSGRDSMPENEGMIFVFDHPDQHVFWMKDMKFALDFIWIREGRVIEITANVRPEPGKAEQGLIRYRPQQPADSMLEVNAGWARNQGISVGDEVILTK